MKRRSQSILLTLAALFSILLTASELSAQTKWIAHRSHSGSDATFSMKEEGNFGLPPKGYFQLPDTTHQVDTLSPEPVEEDPDSVGTISKPSGTTTPQPSANPGLSRDRPEEEMRADSLNRGMISLPLAALLLAIPVGLIGLGGALRVRNE